MMIDVNERMRSRVLLQFIALACVSSAGAALISFLPEVSRTTRPATASRASSASAARRRSTTWLSASPRNSEARRKELLTRRGEHFELDPGTGRIEFGSTAYLVTQLHDESSSPPANAASDDPTNQDGLSLISTWLQDERGLAMSIWDPKMIEDRGDHVFRLQVMTLRFLTLQVAPWVDVEMKTRFAKGSDGTSLPVFCLQSIAFNPNVQILPGMRVTAESFGIVIEVAGQLRPTEDGRGVKGAIAFQTTGKLSRPMRLLPASALQAAAAAINRRVVDFATTSFQEGARKQYLQFVQTQHHNQKAEVIT